MRLNKWLASNTDLSRRKADEVIAVGRVRINFIDAKMGALVEEGDRVFIDGQEIHPANDDEVTLMINKPVGFVCSRRGQGSQTIYELLPSTLQHLKPLGRLDKESSGLILMSTNGEFINKLTHPSFNHTKVYIVTLNKPLPYEDEQRLRLGVDIGDHRPSRLGLKAMNTDRTVWQVTLTEGRNRQIRRSFASVYRKVENLHRIQFAQCKLGDLNAGKYSVIIV